MADIAVVIATRNRRDRLLANLGRHEAPVVVVDNASSDGTPDAVRAAFPGVRLISLQRNAGAAARTIGARVAGTEFVAFADDDSYWAAGSLAGAAAFLRAHSNLGLVAGRVLVGGDNVLDPISAFMARAPLGRVPGLPAPAVLGFLACAAVVRRQAFLAVGGFPERLGTYGEEELLALELAAAGWDMAYVDSLVAHHLPSARRVDDQRDALQTRNALLTAVLKRSLRTTVRRVGAALESPTGRRGLLLALADLPWALRRRRPVPDHLEHAARRVEESFAQMSPPPAGTRPA